MDFGQMGQMKELFAKYTKLQESLKTTIIRAREDGVLVDITWEMKIKDVKIEDENLLNLDNKSKLEKAIIAAFEKGQKKSQEVAMQKTKDILGFDPNDIASMMWWMGWGGMPKIPGLS